MNRPSKRHTFTQEELRNKAFERKKVRERTNACAADFRGDQNKCVEPIIDGEEVIVGGLIKSVIKDADNDLVILMLRDINGGIITVLMSEENYSKNQSFLPNLNDGNEYNHDFVEPVIIRGVARKLDGNRSVVLGVDVMYEKPEDSHYYLIDNFTEIVKGTNDGDRLISDSGLAEFQLDNRCFERYFYPENAAARAMDIALLKRGEWESYMKEKVPLSCVKDADAICCIKGGRSSHWVEEDLLYYSTIIFPLTGEKFSPTFIPYQVANQHVDYAIEYDDDDDYFDDEFDGYEIDETRTFSDTVLVEQYIHCLELCKRENLTKIIFIEKEKIPEGYLEREFTRGSIFKKAKELGVEFEVKIKNYCYYSLEVEPEQKIYEILIELVEAFAMMFRQVNNKRIITDCFSHLYAFRPKWDKETKIGAEDSYIYKFFEEGNENSTIDELMSYGNEVFDLLKRGTHD